MHNSKMNFKTTDLIVKCLVCHPEEITGLCPAYMLSHFTRILYLLQEVNEWEDM